MTINTDRHAAGSRRTSVAASKGRNFPDKKPKKKLADITEKGECTNEELSTSTDGDRYLIRRDACRLAHPNMWWQFSELFLRNKYSVLSCCIRRFPSSDVQFQLELRCM